ncbi:TetR/AcrR family transcriptional regulator [Gordonia neofelifaecis]|uniref:TetR family transcriptional regulator n=1 Tax=Gordonia neofelifaecis NRRL B-59395 TaxID=644548 RepID=F1YF41_9ACTN|nr:TetR/AcrR family transcriptional regulator [Gordonia neofelifaecis]EGD56409.1 TetR family transcriptional regulator [Gordonia neofelifaecis NRRL B-59395]
MADTDSGLPGRRDRNMQEKRDRIFAAAAELFAEKGYDAVTTREVSDRADVAAGTLFRYASSKVELLLMVYNEQFRLSLEAGEERSGQAGDVIDRLLAVVDPILRSAAMRPENAAAYQRELIFGAQSEPHRAAGIELVRLTEAALGRVLAAEADRRGITTTPGAVRAASRSVFAAVHLDVARIAATLTPAESVSDPEDDLRRQLRQIVDGFLADNDERN